MIYFSLFYYNKFFIKVNLNKSLISKCIITFTCYNYMIQHFVIHDTGKLTFIFVVRSSSAALDFKSPPK